MTTAEMRLALAKPFPPQDVRWKPQTVKGNSALAVAYIDSRTVMERLDEVFGIGGWKEEYELLNEGGAMCRISVKIDGEWVQKSDVGSESEQPDPGDKVKASISDALKRCAVHLGIGRYLYKLPKQWADYDPGKRAFVSTPKLPAWAIPADHKPKAKEPAVGNVGQGSVSPRTDTPTSDEVVKPKAISGAKKPMPTTGAELDERLRAKDAELAKSGKASLGQLLAFVIKAGFNVCPPELKDWNEPTQIKFAYDKATEFMNMLARKEKTKGEPTKPWHEFSNWVDDQVTSILDQGCDLDAKFVEQACYKIAQDEGFVEGDGVPRSVIEKVTSYLAKLDPSEEPA